MNKYNIKKNVLILFSIICITFGGLIYLIFRPRTLLMFYCIPNTFISKLDKLNYYINIKINIPDFLIYNLPTALWTISYIIFMQLIWYNNKGIYRFLWIYTFPFFLCLIEILQIISFVPGIFDVLDILSYILPIIISLMIDFLYEKF